MGQFGVQYKYKDVNISGDLIKKVSVKKAICAKVHFYYVNTLQHIVVRSVKWF